jgi:RNA recognition motif-containing protein
MLRQRALDIHYSVPKENAAEPDLNQGTLVVFNMDSSIPRNQILDLFSQFGEVKEIRATPKKEGHKFVEFYDSRHAHAALQGMRNCVVCSFAPECEYVRHVLVFTSMREGFGDVARLLFLYVSPRTTTW